MFCRQCGKNIPEGAEFCRECGSKVPFVQSKATKPKKSKSMLFGIIGLSAIMVVTTGVCINFIKDLDNTVNTPNLSQSVQGDINSVESSNSDSETETKDNTKEVNPEEVKAFLRNYSGQWNVEKYFDGDEWGIYELGKKMAIVAWNYLNDVTITTGGYKKFEGYDAVKEYTYIEGTDVLIDSRLVGLTPVYEYVPRETHTFNGTDIEYSAPYIVINEDTVDMSGMGGPVFNMSMFRVDIIKGRQYLINDDFGFALTYDGDYLEYCEAGAYGQYQGYYAFNP